MILSPNGDHQDRSSIPLSFNYSSYLAIPDQKHVNFLSFLKPIFSIVTILTKRGKVEKPHDSILQWRPPRYIFYPLSFNYSSYFAKHVNFSVIFYQNGNFQHCND